MRAEPTYEIRIADQLDEATLTSFAGLDVTVRAGVTVITGQFDQAALHGVLERIRSLGLDLVEVRRVRGSEPGRRPRWPGKRTRSGSSARSVRLRMRRSLTWWWRSSRPSPSCRGI